MICPNCSNYVPEGVPICPECGNVLPRQESRETGLKAMRQGKRTFTAGQGAVVDAPVAQRRQGHRRVQQPVQESEQQSA